MVFKSILVPVDGSEQGERILEQVRRILLREDAQVVLLRVVPPGGPQSGRAQQERVDAASVHVERLRTRLEEQGCQASALVLCGDPAEVILQYRDSHSPSLVAMSTHGRSGPSRYLHGSVAERVLRGCGAPLLLASPKAQADADGELRFKRVLVPLDGSTNAEAILPTAIEVARLFGAEVGLLRASWPTMGAEGMALPLISPEELERALEGPRKRVAAAGLQVRVEVAYGFEADEILAAAERISGTLLAMTTHGRSGLDRWVFGSVAEKVLRACSCPVLVQRVAAFGAEAGRAASASPVSALAQ